MKIVFSDKNCGFDAFVFGLLSFVSEVKTIEGKFSVVLTRCRIDDCLSAKIHKIKLSATSKNHENALRFSTIRNS